MGVPYRCRIYNFPYLENRYRTAKKPTVPCRYVKLISQCSPIWTICGPKLPKNCLRTIQFSSHVEMRPKSMPKIKLNFMFKLNTQVAGSNGFLF